MGWEAEPGYRAYMLRLRRTDGVHARWLASLDEVSTGERHTFASMEELVAYLRAGIRCPPDSDALEPASAVEPASAAGDAADGHNSEVEANASPGERERREGAPPDEGRGL